jgi:hypothetical protein
MVKYCTQEMRIEMSSFRKCIRTPRDKNGVVKTGV